MAIDSFTTQILLQHKGGVKAGEVQLADIIRDSCQEDLRGVIGRFPNLSECWKIVIFSNRINGDTRRSTNFKGSIAE